MININKKIHNRKQKKNVNISLILLRFQMHFNIYLFSWKKMFIPE
jgi:hypothetical protein